MGHELDRAKEHLVGRYDLDRQRNGFLAGMVILVVLVSIRPGRLLLLMRRVMDRFTEKDYNALIHVFTKERNRRVLEKFERDYPMRYLFRLMLSEPRLAVYARVLLRRSRVENVFRTGDAS